MARAIASSVSKMPGTSTVSDEGNCLRNKNGKFASRKQAGKSLEGRTLAEMGRREPKDSFSAS